MNGYARARDQNEGPIVAALRSVGATVSRLNDPGAPDLLVGFRAGTYLLEVKRPLGARGGMPERRDHEGGRGVLASIGPLIAPERLEAARDEHQALSEAFATARRRTRSARPRRR